MNPADPTQQLANILERTVSPDQNELQAAQSFLEQGARENFPAYIQSLSEILARPIYSPVARMASGLQLKNLLTSKDINIKTQHQQRWLQLPEDIRNYVKKNVLGALGTETTRPSSAAQCVAYIGVIELTVGQWPDLIQTLVNNVAGANVVTASLEMQGSAGGVPTSELLKEASLEAIGYICADIDPQILSTQSNHILTAIVHGMKREEPSNRVRLAATNALLNSLEFTRTNFETETERHYIMQVVCEATQVSDTQVQVAALQCLVKIMSLYYQYMEFYMNLALFAITMEAMKSEVDEVALQGIEFWSNVCDEEVDLAIEASEALEFGRPPQRTSRFYAKGALQYLVPLLIQTLTKQESNDDDDDWNPCKAAGVCLMLLANCCEDDIIPHVVPFVQSNIKHDNWRFRDAAVMAFGCIMEGPDPASMKPLAEEALPTLIALMKDENVVVRDTTAWALGRICEVVSEAALNPAHLAPLLDALALALEAEPRVAANACWALSSLAEAAYETACEGRADDSREPDTYLLSPYFRPLVQKLLATTDRTDAGQANLRPAAYEALMEMIKNSPRDCYGAVQETTMIIMERLRSVLLMESHAHGGDRTQYNELQSSLCATLQSVLRKVTPQDAPRISDAVMDALLQMLNGAGGRSGGVQEDALMAISTLTEVMGEGFIKYMDSFRPFLLLSLQNTTEHSVCSAAVGVSGDICRALGSKSAPYCDDIMHLLLQNLGNSNVHRSVKPQILSVLGDVALAIGPEFKKYLEIVLQTLVQASQAQVDRTDYEMVDYLCELREGVLEAYTGIVQGLRGEAPSAGVPGGPVTPDLAMIEPHLPHIVQFICEVSRDQEKTDGNVAACAGLIGDLLIGYGARIMSLVDNEYITELLNLGRRSKTSKTKTLATWATKELRKLKSQTSAAASCTKGGDTKNWDVFRNLPPESEGESVEDQTCYLFIIKSLKVVAYIVTFIAVLAGAVVAKGSLLLMTSQLEPDRTVPFCNKRFARDKQFEAKIPEVERISWTWAILFAFLVPEIGTFIRSLRICVFKSWRKPSTTEFLATFFFESCHATGLALFVFYVLPSVNVVKAAMLTNCVCLVPSVFGMLSRHPDNDGQPKRILKCIIDMIAILFQLSGLLLWPLFSSDSSNSRQWLLPLSAVLISCGWWENYVDSSSPFAPIRALGKMRKNLVRTRYFTYIFISVWKMLLFFAGMIFSVWIAGGNVSNLFSNFSDSFSSHAINVTQVKYNTLNDISPDSPDTLPLQEIIKEASNSNTVTHTLLIQILASYICYIFGKFACKICIQGFSFAFPVSLAVPVTLSILISLCGLRSENACFWESVLPQYLYWSCPNGDNFISDFIFKEYAWVWLLWLLSQTWVALHLWTPKCERLASTERLFVTPMYNALLIDQSMALNRKRDDDNDIRTDEVEQDPSETDYEEIRSIDSSHKEKDSKFKADTIPRIYACATMWHETKEEMMEMLKSIFRMDEDQCARRVALKYFEVVDPGYYEFETHIFFDDAFELRDEGSINSPMIVNPFVKLMVDTIEEAACHVHETQVRVRPPKKIPTPYGGRLEWVLPGKTKMIAHLKDKGKIRHRKRWSQVMYMYYLLGHRLMELNIPVARKEVIAENTYLLTLDGDIDFHPNAVELLVDLMKKNKNLGAACGRIHPIGSGPMVWYQMFEYAIGHWLQKATEHMIGCVLCSPGCFSLFRGKALMDDNVMAKYTTRSDEPRHYVQYDQGEDRWLCTLLLQRGYRVEYSAASDAKTHCPEGFNEFYNQRRRWVPSTMANIMDLLGDYRKTIKVNPDISMPYICYQFMLMAGTILGPGTIFLMLVGAFVAAFRIDNWTSFEYNLYPIVIFMIICFWAKSEHQLIAAQILSTLYALVMMAVLVGTALQLGEDGIGSPSAIFLISLSSSFFIAALLHPQEFWCIVPGLLYLLSIPSMYLLLIIYSLINLNVVSWGTREVATKKSKQELEQEKKEAEEAKKRAKKSGFLGFIPGNASDDTEGSLEFSFAGLFKVMCCTHQKPIDERQQLLRIADSLEKVSKRLDTIEKTVEVPVATRRRSGVANGTSNHGDHDGKRKDGEEGGHTEGDDTKGDDDDDETSSSDTRERRDDLMNPYWIEDRDLKRGEVDFLPGNEITFWKDLIEKYLKPIDADKKKEARIADELKDLRTRSVFYFFMINAIFVLIVFLMQLNKDQLHIRWPLGIKENITIAEETGRVTVTKEYLQLEPIGLVFVGFFALILIIQFMAMLFHRFGTLSHILAATEITSCTKDIDPISKDSAVQREGVRLIRKFQRLRNFDGDSDSGHMGGPGDVAKRKTIHNLEKQKESRRQVGTLDVAFEKNFKEILNSPDKQAKLFRGDNFEVTFQALKERRSTVLERRSSVVERRKSQMETLKGPILPPNGVANGTLVPSSAASRTRGKAPKPKITNIDFTNGGHSNNRVPILTTPGTGVINQAYIPDDMQMYNIQQNRRNSVGWRDAELADGDIHQREHPYDANWNEPGGGGT